MKKDSQLLLTLGVVSGTISAFFALQHTVNTSFFAYMPGFCFGLVIAITYILNLKHSKVLDTLWRSLFTVLSSTFSYYVAVNVTVYATISMIRPSYELSTGAVFIATAIGGFVGTSLLLYLLRSIGIRYARKVLITGAYGSLAAAFLMISLNSPSSQELSGTGILATYAFYILWQTIILTRMGIPLTSLSTASSKS